MNKKIPKSQMPISICCVCYAEFKCNNMWDFWKRTKSGLFFCSSSCTWSECGKKRRQKHQAAIYKKKFGVDNPRKNPDIIKKIFAQRNEEQITATKRATCIERYGVDSVARIPQIRDKIKKTNLERYGATVPVNGEQIRTQIKNNNLELYGVEFIQQTEEFKQRAAHTKEQRYGSASFFYIGQQHWRDVLRINYGENITNYMQLSAVAQRNFINKNPYKGKLFTLPSGKTIRLQGYEDLTIHKLLLAYQEHEILFKRSEMPQIYYIFENKRRRYWPDFYIPSENTIVETKSSWIFNIAKEKTQEKFRTAEKLGYHVELDFYEDDNDYRQQYEFYRS